MNRRNFLKGVGVAASATLVGPLAKPANASLRDVDGNAILVDLTRCVGCRTCESVCAEANGLPEPDQTDADSRQRETSDSQYTVVNLHATSKGDVYAKTGCMHCVEPACAAACLTKALYKTEEGPVIWRADKCMGCRYCMVSCPFDAPKFEYDSWNPRIQKCQMCWSKTTREGGKPVCVENCPNEALTFGKRGELLEEARTRIYQNPGTYVSQIYGEKEAGGTSILYLSAVPFEELGFRDVSDGSYPELTRDFLTAVPLFLVAGPAFLLSLRQAQARENENPETPAARREEH